MKRHPVAVSIVLGILMSWVATASNATETAQAAELMPVTATFNETPGAETLSGAKRDDAIPAKMSLTAEELTALQDKEAQSPELLKQAAAGCESVWHPEIGEHRTHCRSRLHEGVVGGFYFGFVGFLAAPTGGAVIAASAAVGFIWWYATDGNPLGD